MPESEVREAAPLAIRYIGDRLVHGDCGGEVHKVKDHGVRGGEICDGGAQGPCWAPQCDGPR